MTDLFITAVTQKPGHHKGAKEKGACIGAPSVHCIITKFQGLTYCPLDVNSLSRNRDYFYRTTNVVR